MVDVCDLVDSVVIVSDCKGLSREEAWQYKVLDGKAILDWSSHDFLEVWFDDCHIIVKDDVVVWDGRSICLPSLARKIKGLVNQLVLVNFEKVKPSLWVRSYYG